ncbi:MAG: hypothetical protein ACYTHM_03600 [Planctomycetota bacterium]|jgi:hypothetical protein
MRSSLLVALGILLVLGGGIFIYSLQWRSGDEAISVPDLPPASAPATPKVKPPALPPLDPEPARPVAPVSPPPKTKGEPAAPPRPSAPLARIPTPLVPANPLSPEAIKRREEEARRQAEKSLRAKQERDLKMFEEIMGPLEPETGKAFLEIWYRYPTERSKEWRKRVTEAQQSGIDPPDQATVFSEVLEKILLELEGVLNYDQMQKFRAWVSRGSSQEPR